IRASSATPAISPAATGHRGCLDIRSLWPKTMGLRGVGRAADAHGAGCGQAEGMRTYAELPGLMTQMTGDEKHGPSATSTLDVLWVLYDRVLHVDPDRPDDPDRDRFLLSKGHGPMAYYAVLAAKGFLSADDLRGFGGLDAILGYHPDRTVAAGVEISA